MNVPNWIIQRLVDEKGEAHPQAQTFFSQLITEMQKNLSNEGYVVPSQSSANIQQLSTTDNKAKLLYDAEEEVMKLNNNGKFQQIYTRPQQLTTAEIAAIPAAQINGTWVYNSETDKLLYGINNVFKEVAFS